MGKDRTITSPTLPCQRLTGLFLFRLGSANSPITLSALSIPSLLATTAPPSRAEGSLRVGGRVFVLAGWLFLFFLAPASQHKQGWYQIVTKKL
jgi:hypothetical protein